MTHAIEFGELSDRDRELLRAAANVMVNAYNPISRFEVGAAVRAVSGAVFVATFTENASLGLTICAEAIAIGAAVSAGEREFSAIAVVGAPRGSNGGVAVTPCGRCRQILHEFAGLARRPIRIVAANRDFSILLVSDSAEMLPVAFGPFERQAE